MRLALEKAKANLGLTSPNPVVGCILVRDGKIIGQGATAPGGRPHAEELALDQAGPGAVGATAYVTLEPCGARSAGGVACSIRLVQAGITRVVYACEDASPYASGQGSARLREAGVKVEAGLLSQEVGTALNY